MIILHLKLRYRLAVHGTYPPMFRGGVKSQRALALLVVSGKSVVSRAGSRISRIEMWEILGPTPKTTQLQIDTAAP